MIELKDDRLIIQVGNMRTVVANDKIAELLPRMHESALEDIIRLKHIIGVLKCRIRFAAHDIESLDTNIQFKNGRLHVFCMGEWQDVMEDSPLNPLENNKGTNEQPNTQ